MAHELVWEDNGIAWTYSGKVSGKEVIDTSTSIYGDPRFNSIRYKLVDFREIDSIAMEPNEIALVAYQHKAAEISNPRVKTAIVTCNKTSKQANHFASFFHDSKWEIKIFQDIDKASEWLGRK